MKKVFCQVFKKQKKPAFMLTVAISKRNKLQNIIVLTPKDGKKIIEKIDLINNTPFQLCVIRTKNIVIKNKIC